GADATNPEAVARIFEAKGRPSYNPLIVHASDLEMARSCVSTWPERAEVLAHHFWPGPLTMVLPRSAFIPDIVTAGRGTVGVRIPRPKVARAVIELARVPLAAPSANRSTRISPTDARHVRKELEGRVDLIIDSGPTSVGIESTVLDLTSDPPQVLRPGTITGSLLSGALGIEVVGQINVADGTSAHSSPGQMSIHYAPMTPTFRVQLDAWTTLPGSGRWALISIGSTPRIPGESRPTWHVRLPDPAVAEARLYAALHALDSRRLDFLVISTPPSEPVWVAIFDRIGRASRPWPG
ncbi:L-threonylcarbamoyladenylate synthase, partial [Singulisphaera rosea]